MVENQFLSAAKAAPLGLLVEKPALLRQETQTQDGRALPLLTTDPCLLARLASGARGLFLRHH